MHNHSNNSEQLLKKHGLRVTGSRSMVLDRFLNSGTSLNHNALELQLEKDFDRVTLYRTLNSFVECGILHKIADPDGSVRYALCDDCDSDHHNDEHVHFKCRKCGELTCLDGIQLPQIKLPEGYSFLRGEMVIEGTCKTCNT